MRIATLYLLSRFRGHPFTALDRPVPTTSYVEERETDEDLEHVRVLEETDSAKKYGKFF